MSGINGSDRWVRIFETALGQVLVTKDIQEGDDGEDDYGITVGFYPIERVHAEIRISGFPSEARMVEAFEKMEEGDAVKFAANIRKQFS